MRGNRISQATCRRVTIGAVLAFAVSTVMFPGRLAVARSGAFKAKNEARTSRTTILRVDLARALALARKNNRLLRAARARIGEAKGDLTQASVLLVSNPEIGVGVGPRFMTASRGRITADLDAFVEQSLELGGQRRHRRARARANLHAARASVADTRRVIELAVALMFYRALAAWERITLLRENAALAEALLKSSRERIRLGAGNLLDVNASRLLVAEAKRKVFAARTAYRTHLIRLTTVMGFQAGTKVRLRGSLPKPGPLPSVSSLTRRALRLRPDLRAFSYQLSAVRAAVRLARSSAWPDLTLGVSYAREEGSNAVLFTLRVSLPFFNRNQGRIERARARLRRVKAEREYARLVVSADVRGALVAYRQAARALALYTTAVLSAQKDSVRLLRQSFREGKVGYVKVLLVQQQLIAGRRGYLKARLGLALAQARLKAAANVTQSKALSAGGS